MFREGGHQRKLALIWLLVCLITIPLAMLTQLMGWTGIPIQFSGLTVHLSIYLPLLTCIPLVLWMGFMWGAIPAYLSTFAVAFLSGMPIAWIIVFSLANPLGLSIYTLVYRVTALRIDLKNIPSIVGYGFVSLLSAVTGSTGSFVWAYTVDSGITDTHPIWQGWWLGGWLQATFIVGPILFLFGEKVMRGINAPQIENATIVEWRRRFFLALIIGLIVLIGYIVIARTFSTAEIYATLRDVQNESIRKVMLNAIDTLTYPLFVLLAVVVACTYFVYRAVYFWTEELVNTNKELAEANQRLSELAATDALTNIANRRSIMKTFENALARSVRERTPLAIIMVDADNFKRVNDNYGHNAGDAVLQHLSLRMLGQLRDYDHLGRFGGEEFIVILPNTELKNATIIAERLRSSIENTPMLTDFGEIKMSISLGLAQWAPIDHNVTAFIERADNALRESKQNGRNRVTIAKHTSTTTEE